MVPDWKATGRNTAASVKVVAMMAKATCRAPSTEAWMRVSPSSIRRKMFSNITIASSTTSPIASTSASRVRMLMENPSAEITANVPMIEIGMAVIGMITARQSRRKRKITRMTMRNASKKVL